MFQDFSAFKFMNIWNFWLFFIYTLNLSEYEYFSASWIKGNDYNQIPSTFWRGIYWSILSLSVNCSMETWCIHHIGFRLVILTTLLLPFLLLITLHMESIWENLPCFNIYIIWPRYGPFFSWLLGLWYLQRLIIFSVHFSLTDWTGNVSSEQ